MWVALRKESVDRNCMSPIDVLAVSASLSARRAWIEIENNLSTLYNVVKSLSARRAWIEIFPTIILYAFLGVALRKESVDRNNTEPANMRAYIVALRKESVDRNFQVCTVA